MTNRRRRPRRRRKVGNGSYYREASLFSSAPGTEIAIVGSALKLPARILYPKSVTVEVMSEGGVGAFQLRLFDGANIECAVSKVHLVSPSNKLYVSLSWPASIDPYPLSWNRDDKMFSMSNVCMRKGSKANLVGVATVLVRYDNTEISNTCPTWHVGTPVQPEEDGYVTCLSE